MVLGQNLSIPGRYLASSSNVTHYANLISNVAKIPPDVPKSFFDNMIFGVHIGVIFLLIGTIIIVSGVVLFFIREKLRGLYYTWRWPERTLKVCIHYLPSPLYKVYWRLIPSKGQFDIGEHIYRYDERGVIKQNDILGEERKGDYFIRVGGIEYKIDISKITQEKGSFPEIHYPYNVPEPFDYSKYTKEGFVLSGSKINDLVKSDLWEKALNLAGQNALLLFCLILGVVNLIIGVINMAKLMGVMK